VEPVVYNSEVILVVMALVGVALEWLSLPDVETKAVAVLPITLVAGSSVLVASNGVPDVTRLVTMVLTWFSVSDVVKEAVFSVIPVLVPGASVLVATDGVSDVGMSVPVVLAWL
jgi:hypothetical protein